MVIISQQHFLYNSAIFISINATSIPAPTKHPPQISILISQYTIPATTGLDIPLLICATFFSYQYNPAGNGLYKSGDCIKEYHAIRNKYF